MLSSFSYVQKNKMLIPVFGVGLLLCWFLAFDKTFEAIRLNGKLTSEAAQGGDISFNPVYTQRKVTALDKILKGYKVNEHWGDQLWMTSSAMAAKQNVGVDFTLTKPSALTDSTEVGQSQSLHFFGGYVQLIKLIDTLEGAQRIGKISALQFKAPKADLSEDKSKKCVLRVDFKAL